jgi:hypothetical protein
LPKTIPTEGIRGIREITTMTIARRICFSGQRYSHMVLPWGSLLKERSDNHIRRLTQGNVEEATVTGHLYMNPTMEKGEVISHLHLSPNRETGGRGRDNPAVAHEPKQRDMWTRER